MNALDNIERTLEEWGQQLRGGTSVQGLQPRDVLRALLSSLEAERVEGLDHKLYAPNAFTVELRLDEEERSRLLPFLGRDELESAVVRYCQERKYQFRGPLAVQVVDASSSAASTNFEDQSIPPGAHREQAGAHKVIVQSRFDVPQNWQPNTQSSVSGAGAGGVDSRQIEPTSIATSGGTRIFPS